MSGITLVKNADTGAIESASITFKNTGDEGTGDTEYWFVLSTGSDVDTSSDTAIYKGNLAIDAGAEQAVTISSDQLSDYIVDNSVGIANGEYCGGCVIDPGAAIEESSDSNNSLLDTTPLYFWGNMPMACKVEGTVTIPIGTQFCVGGSMMYTVPTGTYNVYVGMVEVGYFDSLNATDFYSFSDVLLDGYQIYEVSYDQGSGAAFDYTFFVPEKGDYEVVAFMDTSGDDGFWYFDYSTTNASLEPAAHQAAQQITQDLTEQDMTLTTYDDPQM